MHHDKKSKPATRNPEHETQNPKQENKRNPHHLSTGFSDHLQPLEPLDLSKVQTVDDMVRGMKNCSFGARGVGEAADVLEAMVNDKDCFKVLTLSGAMTIAKMGLVVCDMIDTGMIDAIVSTGALMAHGFVESVGMRHFKYSWNMSDEDLYAKGYDRVYDTLELEKNLDDISFIVDEVLDAVPDGQTLSSHAINRMLGEYLVKKTQGRGVLKSAFNRKVPVYVPAFTDSEIGLDVAIHNLRRKEQGKPQLAFNPFLDLEDFTGRVRAARKIGIFTIGGGVPRNWAQQGACYLDLINNRIGHGGDFKRYHYAVRICPEPVTFGGLCLHGDTKIDTPRDLSLYPDGIPIRELLNKENFPVYSYDFYKKRVILANVRKVWSTGVKKLYKVKYGWIEGWVSGNRELKIGETIASAEHKFMLRDGTYKVVSELKANDRLMPFNSYYKKDKHGSYRFISLNNGRRVPEHRFIMEELSSRKLAMSEAVHHVDHNTLNNLPENLDVIDFVDHARYHRFAQTQESIEKQRQTLREITDPTVMQQKSRKFWDTISENDYQQLCAHRKQIALEPEERLRRSAVAANYWQKLDLQQKRDHLSNAHASSRKRWESLSPELRSKIVSNDRNGRWIPDLTESMVREALKLENNVKSKTARRLGISIKVLNKRLEFYGIHLDNHFVISVEPYGETETYDLTVDNTHNFAANGIIVSNSGCTYSEGVSWGKIVPLSEGGKYVEVYDDATIAWPLVVKAVLERMKGEV